MADKRDAGLDAFKTNQEVKTIDTKRVLRVGIIGTGWIAGAHMSQYVKMPDVKIVAAADLVPGKAEEFMKKWGIEDCNFYRKASLHRLSGSSNTHWLYRLRSKVLTHHRT